MTALRLIPILAAALLAAAIVQASLSAHISESFARMVADPWGVVTLIDLYAGFAVILVVIAVVEPDRRVTLLAALLTPVLGSLVPALWLAWRLPLLAGRVTDRIRMGPDASAA